MRKWTRTKKILAVVLSAAMVLTLNTAAFAEEAKKDVITFAEDGDAIITNTQDPISWNQLSNGTDMINAVLLGEEKGEHLANDKKVAVEEMNYQRLSYNAVRLDGYEDLTLLFGYGTKDGGLKLVEGEPGEIPTAHYDGRKKEFYKTGKSSGSKHEDVLAYLGLVKYDKATKTATEIGGVTVGSLKIKDNVDANISDNKVVRKEGEDAVYPKLEGKNLATLTVKPKIKFDKADSVDKGVKKAITAALKDKTYNMAIAPMVIYTNDLSDYLVGGKVSENSVSENAPAGDSFDWFIANHEKNGSTELKANKLKIKGSTPKATLQYEIYLGNGKTAKKTIKDKDFKLTTGTVGGETVAVIDEFTNTNFKFLGARIYDKNVGDYVYDPTFKMAMRLKGKKKIVYGAYKADNNAYVDSVE